MIPIFKPSIGWLIFARKSGTSEFNEVVSLESYPDIEFSKIAQSSAVLANGPA